MEEKRIPLHELLIESTPNLDAAGADRAMSVHIFRESEDGLERQMFEFTYEYERLQYLGHFIERRDSTQEKWPNDKAKPLTYKAWCKRYGWEPLADAAEDEDYVGYLKRKNPTVQKTKLGKPKLSGEMGPIEFLPPCPRDVAVEALRLFKRTVHVEYRNEKRNRA